MGNKVKNLAVLGSTGSIGRQTLEVVRAFPEQFRVLALAAGYNVDLLAAQIEEFRPAVVSCREAASLRKRVEFHRLSMENIAAHPDIDMVVIATSGQAGLTPTLAAVQAGKRVALSSKEALVAAGEIIMAEAAAHRAGILPVDSEHSAIWQCLQGENREAFSIILTASGGPFLHHTLSDMTTVTPARALAHPSWKMGKKVTIDSATLMNKGLEVIEAHWLFGVPFERIRVMVHPQSIVHSLVEFPDGSVKAQLGFPDMHLPIQYALTYPERLPNPANPRLDWDNLGCLSFEQPDYDSFPCLKLAVQAGMNGGTYPAVLCAADEIAVDLFLAEKIKFTDIARLVRQVLEAHQTTEHPSLEQILTADSWAREQTAALAAGAAR